jgi:putative transposase
MIDLQHPNLSVRNQCELLSFNRSTLYHKTKSSLVSDTNLANEIHDLWLEMPFYGYRKITAELNRRGHKINAKRVIRIMKQMNIAAIYPKPNLSRKREGHKIYPYLLSELIISYPNQVWMVDITYLKMPIGFAYLIALIDVYSRYIIAANISNSMDSEFCIEALDKALKVNHPEIVNSDQGSQFTGSDWIEFLTKENIQISMDGKGRWIDNVFIERFWRTVKYEHFFLHNFNDVAEVKVSIKNFIETYNHKRLHQNLNYQTPAEVYQKKNKKWVKNISKKENLQKAKREIQL